MGDSGKGGGGNKHASRTARKIAKSVKAKGSELYSTSRPVWSGLGETFSNFLSQPFDVGDVTSSPLWEPGKLAAEQAYQNAQQNLLSNMPSGGALLQGLGDTERAKANTLTNLAGQVGQDRYNRYENMMDRAMNYGLNMPQIALGGMTGSMGSLSNLAGTEAAANAQQQSAKLGKGGDLGLGAGMLLGGKGGGATGVEALAGLPPLLAS